MRLERLARWAYRRRRLMVAAWIAVLVGMTALSRLAGTDFQNDLRVPGAESQRALDLLDQRFPAQAGGTATIVFWATQGLEDPAVRGRVEALLARIAAVDHVLALSDPYEQRDGAISPDGTTAFATIQFDERAMDLPTAVATRIRDIAEAAAGPGLQIELGGPVMRSLEFRGANSQELLGLAAAVVILLLTFGSAIAMGLPILTAVFGLGIGIAVVGLLTRVMSIPDETSELAMMIGIGVGIDYALLIVTRYRQALHSGLDPEDATAVAITTAGRSAIFAGGTVVISLLGMFVLGLAMVQALALGAIVVVALTVAASVTLLPAALGFAGRSIDRFHIPGLHRDESAHRDSFWFRWSRLVQRRPWPAAMGALLVLVALALPVFSIRLGSADAGSDPPDHTTRRAYDLLSEGFGPGFNGPLLLAVELPRPSDKGALDVLAKKLQQTPGVAYVTPPVLNPQGDTAVLTAFPTTSPQDEATKELVNRLRDQVIPSVTANEPGMSVSVGGVTALFIDIGDKLSARLPLVIGGVIALSFLLLMAVFRSVLVPLKAAVMNVLSIGAAYGVLVAVFQWGWGKGLIGLDKTGPIESFLPPVLFAILFGLSMDYEVFLLSRVREEYLRKGDNGDAVADGLAATARVITAAAAIMVTVFLAFVLGDSRTIKIAGLGLAAAIFIDATLVRMVLVPATMQLLGDANWWFPRWLDRIVPRIGLEVRQVERAGTNEGFAVGDGKGSLGSAELAARSFLEEMEDARDP